LADLADPFDYSTRSQLILAKQLIKHGANVNAVTSPQGETPLQKACHAGNVTNLDFLKLLLKRC
jgi:ankyrin repeat protein